MATSLPVTQQICSSVPLTSPATSSAVPISEVEDCLIYDRHGVCVTFKSLYHNHKAIIIFVRNFLCYTCQEYVEDLSKIPQEMFLDAHVRLIVIGQSSYSHIEAFCSLTGYQHEIYVDPERRIYKKLGMTKGEFYEETASQSPHVKSSILVGSVKSMWRAMTSPAFDFQGDPLQQGGALIIGPGEHHHIFHVLTDIIPKEFAGPNVHVAHFDMNRFNQMPINRLLQLAGMQVVNFNMPKRAKVIDI